MLKMLAAVVLVTVLGLMCVLPAGGTPQQSDGTLQALLTEVRLLRLAIERQGAMAARGQLLVSRLGQCNQRAARARSEAERVEATLARHTQELTETRMILQDNQRQLEAESEAASRADRERDVHRLHQRLSQQVNAEADLRVRRSRLVEQADAEAGACQGIESDLEQLLRELETAQR
jgi:predicted  nucleic acid-binding Zn-ribbon protein